MLEMYAFSEMYFLSCKGSHYDKELFERPQTKCALTYVILLPHLKQRNDLLHYDWRISE